ncbi:hypothetical protein CEXT_177781 [Caerostris extrusa]|uniref:Uncharacterized protein n=1 Tax=Caerostris extrusa TaxID=172846 RepID=A0AAV4TD54_CAEEX|nr:hypothetical protein CEXT_177781 [Caerostris extrusa]
MQRNTVFLKFLATGENANPENTPFKNNKRMYGLIAQRQPSIGVEKECKLGLRKDRSNISQRAGFEFKFCPDNKEKFLDSNTTEVYSSVSVVDDSTNLKGLTSNKSAMCPRNTAQRKWKKWKHRTKSPDENKK